MKNPAKFFPLILAALIAAIYWNALSNSYTYDDRINFSENENIRDLSGVPRYLFTSDYQRISVERYFRPVVTLSYAFEYRLWGINPVFSHSANIFLHIITAVFLYFFLSGLLNARAVPAAAALLFASHPIATNAVTQVNGRMELFCALFSILSIHQFLKARLNPQKVYYHVFASLAFFIFALLSKETAVVLPVILLMITILFPVREQKNRPLLFVFHVFICAAYMVYRLAYIGGSALEIERSIPPGLTFPTMLKALALYMRLLFLPTRLCADYFSLPIPKSLFSADVLLPLAAVSAACVAAAAALKKNRLISFSIGWFFITLIPVMNIIPLLSFVSEKYLYMPMIGFSLFIALVLHSTFGILKLSGTHFAAAVCVIALAYSFGTVDRNPVWKNDLTLSADSAECSPNSVSAHVKLGNELCKAGRCSEAVAEYIRALSLNPADPAIYNNLGEAYAREGDFAAASFYFRQYFERAPGSLDACIKLSRAYKLSGKSDAAMVTALKCRSIDKVQRSKGSKAQK